MYYQTDNNDPITPTIDQLKSSTSVVQISRPLLTSRPASVLSQQGSSGYGSTRSHRELPPGTNVSDESKVLNENADEKNIPPKPEKLCSKEKKDVSFHLTQKGENKYNNNVHSNRDKAILKPFLKTKMYFSVKLPGTFANKSKRTLQESTSEESDPSKKSDTSSSSASVSPLPNYDHEETLVNNDNFMKHSFPSNSVPPALTVETTQTSTLIVRNIPSFPINNMRLNNDIVSTRPNSESNNIIPINYIGSNRFIYDPPHSHSQTTNNSNGVPYSPTADFQNSKNSTAEMSQSGISVRPQSALGHCNRIHFYDQNFSNENNFPLMGSSNVAVDNFKGFKSQSIDNLQEGNPRPTPRTGQPNRTKPTYQNIPNAVKYWENATLPNMTAADIRLTGVQVRASENLESSGSTIVISDVPLNRRNLTLIEVFFYCIS